MEEEKEEGERGREREFGWEGRKVKVEGFTRGLLLLLGDTKKKE